MSVYGCAPAADAAAAASSSSECNCDCDLTSPSIVMTGEHSKLFEHDMRDMRDMSRTLT